MLNEVPFLVPQQPVVDLVGSAFVFVLLADEELKISTHGIGAVDAIAIAGRQLSTIFSSEKRRPW
jgi:hypothetical protein